MKKKHKNPIPGFFKKMNQFPDIPRYDDDVKGEQDDTIHRTDKFHISGLDLLSLFILKGLRDRHLVIHG